MNDKMKLALTLDRIAVKVAARRDEVFHAVKAENPENLDTAYRAAIDNIRWGDDRAALKMTQAEMDDLVSALETCGSFGVIEKVAIELAARLTGCEGVISHKLEASARFSCTLIDKFKGSVADFQASLQFGMGLHGSFQRYAQIHGVTCHDRSVEVNEGYVTIRGELTFTMDIGNDAEIPATAILQDLLSVTISTGFRGVPEKYERTPVRSLVILSSVTR